MCQPAGHQNPEVQRHLDRQRNQVVIPPPLHAPLAPEVAGSARCLMVHLGREADPVLRQRRFVESGEISRPPSSPAISQEWGAVPSRYSGESSQTRSRPRLVSTISITKPSIPDATCAVRPSRGSFAVLPAGDPPDHGQDRREQDRRELARKSQAAVAATRPEPGPTDLSSGIARTARTWPSCAASERQLHRRERAVGDQVGGQREEPGRQRHRPGTVAERLQAAVE